ncbi:MAG: thioredoxin [Firmicutes bacterium]|nr:thioredoxin [Bacillota bacterium]
MSVLTITKDNFMTEVFDSSIPVLLDFWADWCGPCRMTSPLIEEIAEEHPEIKVGKVNVDQERELATMFKVMSIPSLFVVKNGTVTNAAVGAIPKDQIEALL